LEKLEQFFHISIIPVKNNYFLQPKNIQHQKEEEKKEKDEKKGEFLSNEMLAEERWELDEKFQQKLEDLSKYRKKEVDGVLLYYFISFEIIEEKFQKTQERIFGFYRKKKEISVDPQEILNYITSHISVVISLVFSTDFLRKNII
jgi:hypothetical protein